MNYKSLVLTFLPLSLLTLPACLPLSRETVPVRQVPTLEVPPVETVTPSTPAPGGTSPSSPAWATGPKC